MAQISVEGINNLIKSLKDSGFLRTKDLADSYYTINELYEHRLALFKIIAHTYSNLAWKTKTHYDGSMFDDSFLAGITTPLGNATYHFKSEHYSEFFITEIDKEPKYDGYTPDDVLNRLNSLPLLENSYFNTGRNTYSNTENILANIENLNDTDKSKLSNILNELVSTLKEMELIKTSAISDGNHTLKELYKQKREMFKLICHNYNDLAWKSKYHNDGTPLSNSTFLAGINTPLGNACYVLNQEYYNDFKVIDLPTAPIAKDEIYTDTITKLSSIPIRNKLLTINKETRNHEDNTR